ncbi:beta-1,3-glucanase family protein [Deinococcus sp.]|uniref:beta-1,3-glucanase family protein n=1 Tax=Deinococcus sp. TaxID=47478 RepID=UPI003B58CF1C
MNPKYLGIAGLGLALLLSACGSQTSQPGNAQAKAPAKLDTQVLGGGVGLTLDQYQSIQVLTPGFTNRYIRHIEGVVNTDVVTVSSSDILKRDATWKTVRGLADGNCYSFESLNYPGEYLRHKLFRVRRDPNDGSPTFKADATWCANPGLAGVGAAFESYNFRGSYMRHYNGQLWLARSGGPNFWDAAANFNQDTGWELRAPFATGTGGGGGGGGGGGVVLPPAPAGRINLRVVNQTNGAYPDSQVYWAIYGYNPSTRALSYVNRSGNLVQANPADNDAPGHLSKNGNNYANYFNRISDAGAVTIPKMFGARLYLSVGSPMFIKILGVPGGVGFAGPDVNNPGDPNTDIIWDFNEFTYNDIGFFGNTTRVDQFGFPTRIRLVGNDGSDKTLGENVSRDQIFNDFSNIPQGEFRNLVRRPYRILAPKAGDFAAGRPQANYFNGYIDQIWNTYTSRDLVLTNDAGTYRGRVQGGNFVFNRDGGPSGLVIGKPNSVMVFEANGVFDTGSDQEKIVGAQLAAAINRHLVIDVDPSQWSNDSTYYRNGPANFYAKFWHDRSIDGKAYGFAYDDVFSKATLLQNNNPRQVDMIVGW